MHEFLLYLAFLLIELADLAGIQYFRELVDILQTDGLGLLLTLHALLGALQFLLVSELLTSLDLLVLRLVVRLRPHVPVAHGCSHLFAVAAVDGYELGFLLVRHIEAVGQFADFSFKEPLVHLVTLLVLSCGCQCRQYQQHG